MRPIPASIEPPTSWIDGKAFIGASAGAAQHIYAATGQASFDIPMGGAPEVDMAVASAAAAQKQWSAIELADRANMLARIATGIESVAEELAQLQSIETGLPIKTARLLPRYASDWFRWHSEQGFSMLRGSQEPIPGDGAIDWRPIGVVAAILSSNCSFLSAAQVMSAALLCGNSVVLKPSPLAPFGPLRLARLAEDAGLPKGLVNVIQGSAAAGEAIASHERIGAMWFTGRSETAGKVVAATARAPKRLCLELGGKPAMIVLDDADLFAAALAVMTGWIGMSGQSCALPARVLVASSISDRFVTLVKGLVRRALIGDPLDPETDMGPLIDAETRERVCACIDEAGTGYIWAPSLPAGLGEGFFVAPHIVVEPHLESRLARIEVFGPILTIEKFENEAQALAKLNASPFGLSAFVFGQDTNRARILAALIEAGTVAINAIPMPDPSAPFGGFRKSGFGRIGGRDGLMQFVQSRHIFTDRAA